MTSLIYMGGVSQRWPSQTEQVPWASKLFTSWGGWNWRSSAEDLSVFFCRWGPSAIPGWGICADVPCR